MNSGNKNNDGKLIKKLFDACLDLPESSQQQFIENASVSKTIKKQVTELLRHAKKNVDLTQAVVDSVQASLDIKPLQTGMSVGTYQLVKKLGEGGQGEVWLAKRSGGDFNHQVAIKFLKPVHQTHELARFRAERELLASLKHPNIAQLLDGGELADNRPYMVIELVEGLPLLEFTQNENFTLDQYLDCFLQICDAVSYAHSFSVIHRDIKPSNIFITHDGTVKLLDFGIAKFVDKEEIDTQTLPMMTLAYSSPEQVTGTPVSTATDVYALGLLLYEMLTGRRAQAFGTDVPAELIHDITQNTPTIPSSAIQEFNQPRNYGTKQLKGDLDNLILMAVRKEPERRYATVKGMANDIKNYLTGKPLVAVGDGWWYQSRKFITRNPTITTLAAAVLMFLILLPLVMLNNQQKLTEQRDKAIAAQELAQEQTTIANHTTDFLVNILESASPLGHRGEDIKLGDVLASAERQLAVGLDEQPKIKATLLSKLASIHHHLGDTKKSVDHYQNILKIYESEGDVTGQLATLGQLVVMSNFANHQDLAVQYKAQAEALKSEVKDIKEKAWHEARMATLSNQLNQRDEIEPKLLATLNELDQNGINDAELLGRIYNELSISSKNKQQALEYNLKALDYAEQLHGQMHPLSLNRLKNLANKYKRLERHKAAESTLLEVVERAKKLFTKQHPFYGSVIAELGALYHDKGRFSEVEKIYQDAIKISKSQSGEESLNYVMEVNNLAYLYEDMGRYQIAEPLYKKSIVLREKYHTQSPKRIISSKANLARLFAKMGKHQTSQQILNEIMPLFEKHKLPNTQNRIIQTANLIGLKAVDKPCKQALADIEAILHQVQKSSIQSWRRMHNELWLGEMAFECNNHQLAKTLLTNTLNMSNNIYAEDSDGQKMIQNRANSVLSKIN